MSSPASSGFTAVDALRAAADARPQAAAVRTQIDAELRDAFNRFLRDTFTEEPRRDPVLGALFLAVADHLAPVYEAVEEHLPREVLRELVHGLELPGPAAQPAQLVARVTSALRRGVVARTAQVSGRTENGKRVRFAPDHPFVVSPTRLVLAAVHESGGPGRPGTLHALEGAEVADGVRVPRGRIAAPPARGDALYLAFRPADEHHLGNLGLFIDTGRPGAPLVRALRRSPWQLLEDAGEGGEVRAPGRGVLRALPAGGDVHRLEWLEGPGRPPAADIPAAPEFPGYYGPMVWLFPPIPAERRLRSHAPGFLAASLRELLPQGHLDALDEPLAWVRVPLDAEGRGAASVIQKVVPHCMTFSNLEWWGSERVELGEAGAAVSFLPEGNPHRHVVAVLAVSGEGGGRYVEEAEFSADAPGGRYRLRPPLLEITPDRGGVRPDTFARVSVMVSDAAAADGVETDRELRREGGFSDASLQVIALTRSYGGQPPPGQDLARARFAEALRTRGRLVTAADVEVAVRAFHPGVTGVVVEGPHAERTPRGLRPVTRVAVSLARAAADDPDGEAALLERRLEEHLRARSFLGQTLQVRVTADG